ncbi:MAG: hydroxyphenylacetyl-CoA thioesterase PaaI [Sphingobium sp.]
MTDADTRARAVAERLIAAEGTAPVWDVRLDEAREGYARISMTIRADMLNGHRTAHGGMIFALADSAFAYACNSRNDVTVAQQASILFLAPAREGDVLVAEAQEQALVGRAGAYHVSVRNQQGVAIAEFQGLSRTTGGVVIPIEESKS